MARARRLGGLRALPAAVALLTMGCGGDTPPVPREAPVFPGASMRREESLFQERLALILMGRARARPDVRVYATTAAFSSVVDFYESQVPGQKLRVQRFAIGSRMRELAQGVVRGGKQQLAVGRLLFSRGSPAGDSLPAPAVADSLKGLADRLAAVEGLIALGRIPLDTSPPSAAVVSIERPHLNASTLTVDSLTVIILGVQPIVARRPAP